MRPARVAHRRGDARIRCRGAQRALGAFAPALRCGLRRQDVRGAVTGRGILRGAARAAAWIPLARPPRPFLGRARRDARADRRGARHRRRRHRHLFAVQDLWRPLFAVPATDRKAGTGKRARRGRRNRGGGGDGFHGRRGDGPDHVFAGACSAGRGGGHRRFPVRRAGAIRHRLSRGGSVGLRRRCDHEDTAGGDQAVRSIPAALQSKLDAGITTLCRCWLVARNDGVTQGFTDHDEDIVLGGVICRADSGLTGSEVTQKLGLAVDSSELSGALASDTLNEADLAAVCYDAAAVEVWLVDWSEPPLRVLLAKGTLGEVRRDGRAFTAEVRGLSDRLAQETGRLYTATCSADLGDARCKVDLGDAALRGSGAVSSLAGTSTFTASGLDAFADGWFTAGKLTFTGGANAGLGVARRRVEAPGFLCEPVAQA